MIEHEWAFATDSEVYFTGQLETFDNEATPPQLEPGLYELREDGSLVRVPEERVDEHEQPCVEAR
jgi:hypothetical protein